MKNAYNTSAYGSFAYVYDIFMENVVDEKKSVQHNNRSIDAVI